MKKTLFFIATTALCASVMAQTTSNQFYKKIGETYYNTFTNSVARNTIGFDSQSLNGAAVWIMGSSSSNRGTGINYYNANNNTWGSAPNPNTGRIETEYTGWGTHGFTEEGEIVVAHNSNTGLIVNTRDIAGEGAWQQYLLQGPSYLINGVSSTKLLWPTLITKGNTVHMVCVTDQWPGDDYPPDYEPNPNLPPHGYLGFPTLPLYYRSTDGGKTWETPRDFREYGMTSLECFRVGADEYILTARGNHVVLLYYSGYVGFLCYLESKDGGDTWVKKTIYDCGMDFAQFDQPAEPRLLPTCASVCIDENHKVHVVFSAQCRAKPEGTNMMYNYWGQLPVGMIYWNEDREPIDWHDIRGWRNENDVLLDYNWDTYQDYIPAPSVIGLDHFYFWENSPQYNSDQYNNSGWAICPRLLAKDGRVYVSYQSPLDFAFEIYGYYRGIFITVSEDYGETWDVQNNTSWISYHPDLQFIDWDNYIEPSYTPEGEPEYNPAQYVMPIVFSENSYPSMSYNNKGDLFILQWANKLEQFSSPIGYVNGSPISVYTFTQDLKNIPAYKNIQEVCRGLWNGTDSAIVFPPQSCEKPAEFTAIYNDNENIVVLNWEEPEYISQPLVGYNIFCNGNKINDSPITETHFEVQNPEPIILYYQVSAVYSSCESNLSYGVTIIFVQFCENPVGLTGIDEEADAILSWIEPENIDGIFLGYNLYRNGNKINEIPIVATEYRDENLAAGTYTYQVSAAYAHCVSEFSDDVSVTIEPQLCEPPANLSAIEENNTILITWNEPENIDGTLSGYNIYRDENQINEALLVETKYIDIDLDPGTYTYQVSAIYEHCDESGLTEGFEIVYVGITDLQLSSFNIFPNPTTGKLTINNEQLTIDNVEIFDIMGRKQKTESRKGEKEIVVNISELPAGVYFVKISTESGILTKKVIKF